MNRVGAVLTARAIPGTLPAIDHGRGLILLARGEVSAAHQALESASESWQARRRFWEGTWARLDLAEAAARARRRGEAAVLLDEARTIAAAAGAATLVDAADRLTASFGPGQASRAVASAERTRIRGRPARRGRPHQPADRPAAGARAQDDLGTRHAHPHQTGRRPPRRDRGMVRDRPT